MVCSVRKGGSGEIQCEILGECEGGGAQDWTSACCGVGAMGTRRVEVLIEKQSESVRGGRCGGGVLRNEHRVGGS